MEGTDSLVLLTPKHRQKWHYHLENVATYKLEFHLFKKQNSLIINGFFFNSLVFTSNILSLPRERISPLLHCELYSKVNISLPSQRAFSNLYFSCDFLRPLWRFLPFPARDLNQLCSVFLVVGSPDLCSFGLALN